MEKAISLMDPSPTNVTLPAGFNDEVYGALLIGVALSIFLFGVLTVQIYYYFEHYESDARWIKSMASRSIQFSVNFVVFNNII
jgi:hypothetical protein